MSSRLVLDSWAILHMLEGGTNAEIVAEAIDSGRSLMSWINLGEVTYVLARRYGRAAAMDTVSDIRARLDVHLPDEACVIDAAAIKAVVPMSYADAFAAATANRWSAALMTGDPELMASPGVGTGTAAWDWIDLRVPIDPGRK